MKEKIEKYKGPAGGWGALKAVAEILAEQEREGADAKALFKMNKHDGFDCPGCAWPNPERTPIFDVCENGAKAVAWEATRKKLTPEMLSKMSVTELSKLSAHELEDLGRLTYPLKYDAASDTYQPIEWDVAFKEIGAILQSYDDPTTLELYTSGRTSNEAAFLYQLFGREYGTNNYPDCSNMCHEPTSVGLGASIGVGKSTVTFDDFETVDLVIDIGHNPGTNHPRILSTYRALSKRGATLVAVNPLKERGLERFIYPQNPVEMLTDHPTKLASHYYNVRVGGDVALVKGLMRVVIERHEAAVAKGEPAILDLDFIKDETVGYEAVREDVLNTSWDDITRVSGLTKEAIEEFAGLYIKAERTIICYGMGITQHEHGTQNIQQLVNLLLLKGNMGRPGAGILPLRGHSNVQGDRTVGITEKPSQAMLDKLEARYGFTPPTKWGHAVVASVEAMYSGQSKAFIGMGGNFAEAMPDHDKTYQAMKNLDLAVHIATKMNRSHLLTSKNTYLLPVLGRTEIDMQATGRQVVTIEDSMNFVTASCGILKPISPDLLSECAVVAGIAKAAIPDTKVKWDELVADYSKIRDDIEFVYPDFKDYNERIKAPAGFHLQNPASIRKWVTKSGKANFFKTSDGIIEDPDSLLNAELTLTTLRSHDQYNTTIYGLNDRYRGVFGQRDVLFISEAEAKKQGIKADDRVNIIALDRNRKPTERRLDNLRVVIYDIADRSVATYFPEANNLVALENMDQQSGIPVYKNIPIAIELTQ
ncbi:FdhF/YdeP family oxidoreductase [Ignatzschineria cameli]|uniref:CbbBc protein n=1 Tax=Ignatzschineria cameli TaxID=2182793 RepID=A0A2U2AS91_9GAMM|nr:FdhF/YdeP family oxidoreductase [Ignatzschineria cameli]PWD87136.1 CbbBc protein [Ignatzschineria cameli]PWD92109.1 CbbBc protein [Ignatzschineria cameli]PWD93306.1 CbbBc protein [Ignatzschineria cameli]PWD94048.1 CbbBc protein [Ignatzschineria cameli]